MSIDFSQSGANVSCFICLQFVSATAAYVRRATVLYNIGTPAASNPNIFRCPRFPLPVRCSSTERKEIQSRWTSKNLYSVRSVP